MRPNISVQEEFLDSKWKKWNKIVPPSRADKFPGTISKREVWEWLPINPIMEIGGNEQTAECYASGKENEKERERESKK